MPSDIHRVWVFTPSSLTVQMKVELEAHARPACLLSSAYEIISYGSWAGCSHWTTHCFVLLLLELVWLLTAVLEIRCTWGLRGTPWEPIVWHTFLHYMCMGLKMQCDYQASLCHDFDVLIIGTKTTQHVQFRRLAVSNFLWMSVYFNMSLLMSIFAVSHGTSSTSISCRVREIMVTQNYQCVQNHEI